MKNMRFKAVFFILLFVQFLFITPFVYAEQSETIMKGISCGVPGGSGGTDKCCVVNTVIQGDDVPPRLSKEKYDQLFQEMNGIYNAQPCNGGEASTLNVNDPACKCLQRKGEDSEQQGTLEKMCDRYRFDRPSEKAACIDCSKKNGYWAGIGCVSANLQSFAADILLSLGLGAGGLVAFLCILYSAFVLQTSQGNPERIKKAKEYLTNCIIGLVIIGLSIFILRFVGVNILRIPFLQ